MRWVTRTTAPLLGLLVLAAGCQTMTGRTVGQWTEDKAITAKVKSKLAATKIGSVSRVNVDTFDSTVYLTGAVESEQDRARMIDTARRVGGVREVVNNLRVRGEAAAASPSAGEQKAPVVTPPTTR